MSNVGPEGVSTLVERQGVTVEKSYEPDDFPVPAIAFVVRSDRDETVEVSIVERLPEGVDTEDIGLHPKYGAEHWTLEDDRIVFERDFEPGEEYTTVYGVRARDRDDVGRFLDEPQVAVLPVLDGQNAVNEVVSEADSSSIEAALGAVESDGETEADVEDADVPTVDSSSIEAALGGVEQPPAEEGNIAAHLAAQLRDGSVSQADLDVLREALTGEVGGSVDARVGRLQREVSDLQAYTDALEAFLDENGDAQTLLSDLRTEIESLSEDIDQAVSGANIAEETASSLETRFETLQSEVASLSDLDERVTQVEGQVDDLESLDERVEELTDLGARVEGVETTTGDLTTEVDELDAGVEGLTEDVASVNESVDSLESEVDGLREDVSALEAEAAESDDLDAVEERIGSLETELEGIRGDLDGLAQMREQLRSVFGAGALADDDEE